MGNCISSETLRQYATGKLVGAAGLACEEHVELCSACQLALGLLFDSTLPAPRAASDFATPTSLTPTLSDTPVAAGHLLWKQSYPTTTAVIKPERVGRYRIDEPLGSGGFGRVYLAFDEQLKRNVAVKIPHASLIESQEHLAIMLAEAQTVASLDHPGILPIYDVGSTDQIPIYLVSKLISGTTLADQIRTKAFSPELASQVVAQVADALQYSHDRGVIHGDVKPQNILIDEAGQVVLADFGLAWQLLDSSRSHRRAGTPAYMSPEQLSDAPGAIDDRSDLFSLGKVLQELLETCTAAAPPSVLRQIVEKATAIEQEQRYDAASDLAQALRDYVQSQVTAVCESNHRQQIGSPVTRTRVLVRTVVVASLMLTVCIGWFISDRQRSSKLAVQSLMTANDLQIPERLHELTYWQAAARPALLAALESSDASHKLRAKLALMSENPALVDDVNESMLSSDATFARLLARLLEPYRTRLINKLWALLMDQEFHEHQRVLNAAMFLASVCPDDQRWHASVVQQMVANAMMQEDVSMLNVRIESLQPVHAQVAQGLRQVAVSTTPGITGEQAIRRYNVWSNFVRDDLEATVDVLLHVPPTLFSSVLGRMRPDEATLACLRGHVNTSSYDDPNDSPLSRIHKQHIAAMALLALGQDDEYFALWQHTTQPDNITSQLSIAGFPPLTTSAFLNRLGKTRGLEPRDSLPDDLEGRLFDPQLSERRNLLLALEHSGMTDLPDAARIHLIDQLRQLCVRDADPGMRAAAELTLFKLNAGSIPKVGPRLRATGNRSRPQRWAVNTLNEVMITIPSNAQVPYDYAIAGCEVTRAQFEEFLHETNWPWIGHRLDLDAAKASENGLRAQIDLSWYDCAAFCNWLSTKEGLQTCYEPNDAGLLAAGMRIKPDILRLNGYRMPTGAEWEVAARAGATTQCYFGDTGFMLHHFAWTNYHARGHTQPVGLLIPNSLGLFDVLGNASEWTMDCSEGQWQDALQDTHMRIHRGGDFNALRPSGYSCSTRNATGPNERLPYVGLRIVRSID